MRTIKFSPPDITQEEIAEVTDTLLSGWITTGPKTKEFERQIAEYCHVNRAACLNSQTACAEMTLRILGIGEGDEVIVPAYTYTATCSVVFHVGAKPVMVDIQKNNLEMDYDAVASAITNKTKAIIPVDLAGIICDYNRLFSIVEAARSKFVPANDMQKSMGRIAIIADGAHSFGAKKNGMVSGSIADFTAFSFHAVKNLTTGEGGAVAWKSIKGIDDEFIYKQYMLLSLHGQSKDALSKTQLGSWEYDIVDPLYKCNMTDIMASIGLAQLKRYDGLLARRREIISMYDEGFKDLPIKPLNHYGDEHQSSGHLYIVSLVGKNLEYRNEFIKKMALAGIATNVHYKPLAILSAYEKRGYKIVDYPNAYKFYASTVTLPLHTKLSNEDVQYIIQTVRGILA